MPFTDRQLRIARLVLRGHSNNVIADALQKRFPGLTARTVRSEVDAIKSLLPGTLPARQRIVLHLSRPR